MLGQQFWIAVPIGVLIGLGAATWRWYTRARWQTWEFRKTPWEIISSKKTVNKIKHDQDSPTDGVTLGVDIEDGKRVVQTHKEASGHTFLVGGSGAGKTRTAFMRIRDQIKQNDGVVIVDLKGDPEVANMAKIYCDRYGRKFQHFTLQDISELYTGPAEEGPAHYDPLAQGDHTRRADMVLDLRDWEGAEYFKKMTQSYLQLLFTVHINNPPKDGKSALEDAVALMSPKYLQERARPLATNPIFSSYINSINALNDEKMSNSVRENLQTNRSQLEIFLQGVAGPWLALDRGGNNISLLDAAVNGDVVVFSLDSQAYPTLSADIANLIIQDLKTVSSELLKVKNEKPFHVFIDEFSAIGSDNIVGLINKARASNMYVTLATQTLGDLVIKNPALRMQIMGIISSFIIHRANTEEDAIIYAGLTGTTTVTKVRQSVELQQGLLGGISSGIGTGTASVEEIEQWKVMPTQIQDLSVGEMFYINTSEHRIKHVKCIIEDIADPHKGGTAMVLTPQSQAVEVHSGARPSLEKSENVVSRDSLQGNISIAKQDTPDLTDVNHEFTKNDFQTQQSNQRKEAPMTKPKKTSSAKVKGDVAKDAFAEVRDMEKVPLNYDLLRTFFNDKNDVDTQENEDIADGIVAQHYIPSQQVTEAPPAPVKAPQAPTTPVVAPSRSTGQLPTRPSFPTRPQTAPKAPPSKSEFDF